MKPIWIVDDDQSIRFVLERALQREGLETRSFTQGNDVLAALADAAPSALPSVLVSDIRMPGVNGLELLTKVKARQPDLPIIIMTAYSDLDSAVSAFQGGHSSTWQNPLMSTMPLSWFAAPSSNRW